MPTPTYSEMAQYKPVCSKDDLISTLIAAASSHRYTPTAPSPLNPTSNDDTKPRKHAARPKRLRPARKKSTETPTERLLRRKAAIAYERTTNQRSTPSRKDGATVIVARPRGPSEKGPSVTFAAKETTPMVPMRAGPPKVNWWEIRHSFLSDVERQPATQLSGLQQGPASRQRLEILLMLVLLSACLTLLTVVGLDSLKGHYVAG
ncbi:hypothetical protein VP1G_10079 [Cytospora mali]|uniref:Uncharacterized protein n=1 Tax=Cytospora mali TaxID=578113 RepID=A0A194VG26_CYTMA|nr:hypothetical protein VP1G_10079 [Valsa mali var. pyri (nom. inval.)]